jgi:hypothetical protein
MVQAQAVVLVFTDKAQVALDFILRGMVQDLQGAVATVDQVELSDIGEKIHGAE